MPTSLSSLHRRRLRDVWRSAGWPCQDGVELELLAAGLLERLRDPMGRETVRVTEAGIQALAAALDRHRAARSAHEALVDRVANCLARDGRIAWCGLALRARVPSAEPSSLRADTWVMAIPDLYSVRHTTVPGYLDSAVHEIKVRRADLLADLRRPTKRTAYLDMAGACWYVLAEGVGDADDVPASCGVIIAPADPLAALQVQRNAPRRTLPHDAGLPFAVWMALARAAPKAMPDEGQLALGADEAPDLF